MDGRRFLHPNKKDENPTSHQKELPVPVPHHPVRSTFRLEHFSLGGNQLTLHGNDSLFGRLQRILWHSLHAPPRIYVRFLDGKLWDLCSLGFRNHCSCYHSDLPNNMGFHHLFRFLFLVGPFLFTELSV